MDVRIVESWARNWRQDITGIAQTQSSISTAQWRAVGLNYRRKVPTNIHSKVDHLEYTGILRTEDADGIFVLYHYWSPVFEPRDSVEAFFFSARNRDVELSDEKCLRGLSLLCDVSQYVNDWDTKLQSEQKLILYVWGCQCFWKKSWNRFCNNWIM
jgi:hypothetical protein